MIEQNDPTGSKKILIVEEMTYPFYGGQQIRYRELAAFWANAGHNVTLCVIDHVGDMPVSETIDGVKIHRLIKEKNYYKTGKFGRKLSTILWYTLKLRKFFNQNFDLIIFNQFPVLPAIYHGLFYKSQRSKTILDFVEHRSSNLWIRINKVLLNSTGYVVCISKHVARCVNNYRKHNVSVIPSLINFENPSINEKDAYLFLGRMEPHKHPEDAIRAVLEYNKLYNKASKLRLLGGGKLFDELVEKYSKERQVEFFGSIDDAQKLEVLSKSRILIFPSEREGLPKTVIEAMAFGIPTVTTNYIDNGTKYFVEDENIGLIAEPTPQDIAAKIKMVEERYQSFEKTCLDKRSEYYLSTNANKFINLIT